MFSYCIVLIVRFNFGTLTACHLLFLRCLMHVKLNVIKLFNRLSLPANQNTAPLDVITTMSTPVKLNNIRNSLNDGKTTPDEFDRTNDNVASIKNNQKFIISSNFHLHEDDLSRIDVKSLVRVKTQLILISSIMMLFFLNYKRILLLQFSRLLR